MLTATLTGLQDVKGDEHQKIMPEEITLADGTTREVPTEEELKNLQAGHDANIAKRETVQEFNKVKESLDLKEGQSIKDRLQEMKDSVNPNFAGMRAKLKAVTEAAKEKGVKVDSEGNIQTTPTSLTADDVKKTAQEVLAENAKETFKQKALSNFNEKEAKDIEAVFDKLDKIGGDVNENMQLAIKQILPDQNVSQLNQARNASGGGAPRQTDPKDLSNDLKSFGANFGLSEDDFNN